MTRVRCTLFVSLFGVMVMAGPLAGTAQAQDAAAADAARDAEGRGLFEAGRAAFTDGRYEDALDYFDRAYELSHRAELLYNIGTANDRLRRDEAAIAAFEQYLAEVPDAPNAREIEGRVRVLREQLALEQRDAAADPFVAEETPTATATTTATSPSTTSPSTTVPAEAPPSGGPGVVGEWWFWTLIGAVVAGGIVAGVVLGTQSSGTTYPAYDTGTEGTTMTLTATF